MVVWVLNHHAHKGFDSTIYTIRLSIASNKSIKVGFCFAAFPKLHTSSLIVCLWLYRIEIIMSDNFDSKKLEREIKSFLEDTSNEKAREEMIAAETAWLKNVGSRGSRLPDCSFSHEKLSALRRPIPAIAGSTTPLQNLLATVFKLCNVVRHFFLSIRVR